MEEVASESCNSEHSPQTARNTVPHDKAKSSPNTRLVIIIKPLY